MTAMIRFALTLSCVGLAGSVTPVQKAVQMLEGMLVTAKAAKHKENVQFAGFSEFCKNVEASKAKDIEDAKGQIELLNANVEKANSEVERLKKEIGSHGNDITGWNQDKTESMDVREKERATYLETHRDYQESIGALGKAVSMLKQQNYDRSAKSFLQKVSVFGKTPEDARQTIQAFVQAQEPDVDSNLGYKATAYKFKSGSIITMLEKLKAQFKDELTTLEKAEVARRHTYDSLQQDLSDQTADAQNAIQEKTVNQAKNKQASIEKLSDLHEVTGLKESDSKYLGGLTKLCEQKTAEFESRTKLRDGEIEALDKAVEILSGDEVGNATKHAPSFAQGRSSSFAQLRAATINPNQRRVIDFLRTESVRLESHVLSTLATEASADASADVFEKVKKLIQQLIDRLMSEATNEASHKGWCDKELATNKHTRETKSAEVDALTSTIEGLDSDIKSGAKDIDKKTAEVAKIEAAVAEFTDKRTKEKASNEVAMKEAEDGQKAIAQAVKVLQDFYAKAAKAIALEQHSAIAQKGQPKIPEIFAGPYQGNQAAKGGLVGMLQVIQSDFARLEADTKGSEQAAKNEYDEFMSDSAQTKASLDVGLKHATTAKLEKEGELTVANENLVTAQKTLDSAQKTFEKLKEPCLGGGQTYADRKVRRKDEIESLKKALEILSADNLPQ